jgi:hypothetical protein
MVKLGSVAETRYCVQGSKRGGGFFIVLVLAEIVGSTVRVEESNLFHGLEKETRSEKKIEISN